MRSDGGFYQGDSLGQPARPTIWSRLAGLLGPGGGRPRPVADPASLGPLTADDVKRVRFGATKFREGYDQDEVDDFLDRVESFLRQGPHHAPTGRPLTESDVINQRFTASKFREGYDQDDVDDFMDHVVAELNRRR